jgi:hypothetical protein
MASNVLRTVLTKRGSAFVRVNSRQARTRAAGDFTPDELAQGIKKKVDKAGNFKGEIPEQYEIHSEWFYDKDPYISKWTALTGLVTGLSAFGAFYWYGRNIAGPEYQKNRDFVPADRLPEKYDRYAFPNKYKHDE